MESGERKEHVTDGQTGEENVQSDTAVELAGATSERDKAKEVSTAHFLVDQQPNSYNQTLSHLLQEHGTGSADASQAEGHDSTLMARMSSERQRRKQTQVCGVEAQIQDGVNCYNCFRHALCCVCVQNIKRKPGRADNERSLGDASERVHKRLRTVESTEQRDQDHPPNDTQQESDMYEHIRQGEEKYDKQTYGEMCAFQNSYLLISIVFR